jgi:hypothetical protein
VQAATASSIGPFNAGVAVAVLMAVDRAAAVADAMPRQIRGDCPSRPHGLLGLINTQLDEVGMVMQRMVGWPMTGNRLTDCRSRVMPLPTDDDELRSKVTRCHDLWSRLFNNGDGNDRPGVRGSMFAAYNAVTQWVDRDSYTSRCKEPLRTIWFGQGARLKQRAFATAEQLLAAADN